MLNWLSAVEPGVCYQFFQTPQFETDLWLLICFSKSVISTVPHLSLVQGPVCKAKLKEGAEKRKVGVAERGTLSDFNQIACLIGSIVNG